MAKYRIRRKVPTAAYGGSLIQQNHGETLNGHGFLIWNIEDRNYEFVEVRNDFGFVTLDIKNGAIVKETIPDYMPKHPKIRLKTYDTTPSQLRQCLVEIRKKYNPEEVSIQRGATIEGQEKEEDKLDFTNIRDVNFQNQLITDYLERNFSQISESLLTKIYEINTALNAKLPVLDVIRNVVWKPKMFTFSNMFSYGEGNVIDFSKMKGVVGLFANNASGKSSILEALSFCLFDKGSKTSKAIEVMNNQRNNFSCKLNFEIDGTDYFVTRTAVKKGDAAPCPADFFKVLPNGDEEPLNGEARRDTAAIVRSYVGDYADFALTALSAQNGFDTNFIQKSQSQRKDLLMKFLDLSIFDQLYDIGNKEISDYKALLKKYEIRHFDEELTDLDANIDRFENENRLVVISKNSLIKVRDSHNEKILDLTAKLIPTDKVTSDVSVLERKRDAIKDKIESSEEDINLYRESGKAIIARALEIKTQLNAYKELNLEEKYDDLLEQERLLKELATKKSSLKTEIMNHAEKIERLKKLEYNPDCDSCKKNILIADADTAKARSLLETAMKSAEAINATYQEVALKIAEYDGIKEKYESYEEVEAEFKEIHMKSLKLNSDIAAEETKMLSMKNDLVGIESDILKYYKNKEAIESNKKLDEEIRSERTELDKILDEISDVESKELDVHSKLLFFQDKKKETEKEIEHFKDVEEKVRAYTYYLEAIDKDGIPYELISKSIPMIESEVNNILSQVTEFTVSLELDKKNINIRIVYDENRSWPAELGSGMEQFITGLAVRVALINVSHLPRPNFISIDEGFTSLDADNLSNLPTVFDYLRNQFDFCVIISHLEQIRDFVDMIMDLKKEEEFSKIVFK